MGCAAGPATDGCFSEERGHVGDELHEACAADDQFADEIEQHVETLDANPHRLSDRAALRRRRGSGGLGRRGDVELDTDDPVDIGSDRDRAAGGGCAEHNIEGPQVAGGGKLGRRRS